MVTIPKTVLSVNPKVNDKWYNLRRFMGEKTQENSGMGYSAAYPTGRERIGEKGCAILSSDGRYTSFSYGGDTIRFMTSPQLVRYEKVLKWDNGYIEVIANYNGKEEEEYIDLVPILENLLMDASAFLNPIERVKVSNA